MIARDHGTSGALSDAGKPFVLTSPVNPQLLLIDQLARFIILIAPGHGAVLSLTINQTTGELTKSAALSSIFSASLGIFLVPAGRFFTLSCAPCVRSTQQADRRMFKTLLARPA